MAVVLQLGKRQSGTMEKAQKPGGLELGYHE